MKYVALLSGGKDSCYNLLHCRHNGHELIAAASLGPQSGKEEIDSYLYQTVGQDAIDTVADALGVPLYRRSISGTAVEQSSEYGSREAVTASGIAGDETEDLHELLAHVKSQHPGIQGVSVGAILSNYQRVRVEHVCTRLSLTPLCYLWQRDQDELLSEMVNAGMEAVLIKVAGIGLSTKHLGKSLAQMQPLLRRLNSLYGAHICGEGGEYETLTLDSPMFNKRINLDEVETVIHSDNDFATVAYLRIKKASLQAKNLNHPYTIYIPPLLQDDCASAEKLLTSFMDKKRKVESCDKIPADTSVNRHKSYSKAGKWVALSNIQKSDDLRCISVLDEVNACFGSLKELLTECGLSVTHLAFVNIFISNMADFALVNTAYKTSFGTSPPARACVAVDLPDGVNVRLDCIAHADKSPQERRALHVQSLSYWAPANIGPYSQAVVVGNHIFVSGQIGMHPSTLSMPDPANFSLEAALSFQHAHRIISAVEDMYGSNSWRTKVQCMLCWLIGETHVSTLQKINEIFSQYSTVPTLIIGAKSLPKNAQIETQVIAHTGQCSVIEDDEINACLCTPTFSSGTLGIGHECRAHWEVSAMSEDDAFSGFIAMKDARLEDVGDLKTKIGIPALWSQTYYIRLFYTDTYADTSWAFAKTMFISDNFPAITVVPARFIATRLSNSWDFALCIIGSS